MLFEDDNLCQRRGLVRVLCLLQVDAAVLQYQNQKLVQQLEAQKHELHDLEAKIQELKERQSSYDDMLTTLKQLWNEVCFLSIVSTFLLGFLFFFFF